MSPQSVLLTGTGQRHPLTAKAFNGQGAEVPATFTWTSSKPDQVAVDAAGGLQAVTAIGSATIHAEAGGVRSPAVPVATVQPKAGALLVTDTQIVDAGTPFIPPGGDADLRGQVDVQLRNVTAPAPGTVVLSTEGARAEDIAARIRQDARL